MKNKALSWLSTFVWLIPSAFAAENILDTIFEVLGPLGAINLGAGEKGLFFARFLAFIIIFSVAYFGLKVSVFKEKEQRNFAIWVALAFALGAVLIIPQKFIIQIFETYAVISIAVMIGGPLLGMLWATRIIKEKFQDHPRIAHVLDAVLFYILAVAMKGLNENLKTEFNILKFDQWFNFAYLVCIIIMFWNIAMIFFSKGAEIAGATGVKEAIEKVSGYGPGRGKPWTEAAKPTIRREYNYERQIVNELGEAIGALQAKPPDLIDIAEKLTMAGERSNQILAITPFIRDLQDRAVQIGESKTQQKIKIFGSRIIANASGMREEITKLLKVFGPIAQQIQQLGPLGTKATAKFANKKFIDSAIYKLKRLIKAGEQIETDIVVLEALDDELEG